MPFSSNRVLPSVLLLAATPVFAAMPHYHRRPNLAQGREGP